MPVRPIFQGIVVALFFQCIRVLLSPTNPIKGGIRWTLVAHTVALFLFLTIPLGIDLNWLFITYVDYREFPGSSDISWTSRICRHPGQQYNNYHFLHRYVPLEPVASRWPFGGSHFKLGHLCV